MTCRTRPPRSRPIGATAYMGAGNSPHNHQNRPVIGFRKAPLVTLS
jgi:hypothetical protein